jgi:hypothetical protein
MGWAEHIAWGMCDAYKILTEKTKENRPRGKTMKRPEDNIKMNLKHLIVRWTGLNCIKIGHNEGFY